jgi:hypothetical protein
MTNAYYVKVISATKIAVYEDAEFTRPASFNFDDFSGVPLITKIQNSSLGITYDSFFVNPISSVSTGILLTYTYYAGSIGTFIVPDNVSTITVTVVGAGGGSGGNYQNATTLGSATSGTAGSIVLGDLNVQGGQVLTIYPGFGGSRGLQSWNGGVGGTGGVNYFPAYSGSAGVTSNKKTTKPVITPMRRSLPWGKRTNKSTIGTKVILVASPSAKVAPTKPITLPSTILPLITNKFAQRIYTNRI